MLFPVNYFMIAGSRGSAASMRSALFGLLAAAFLPINPASAELPAFPGAEGAGATAVGGRGGIVCEVTTLADSGPGSLRECIDRSGPRTVIFRVGGTIELNSQLRISNPYITIAGQTAPGGGIQIRASASNWTGSRLFLVSAGNVIIRYIRLRPGANPVRVTAVSSNWSNGSRVIFDHVSISWSFNGNGFSVWQGPSNITLQNSVIAENRTNILSGSGSESASLAVKNLDIHNNVLASASHRNPMLKTDSVRFVNNIVYNWTTGVSRTAGGVHGDFIANLYKEGPSTLAANSSRARQELHFVTDPDRDRLIVSRDPSLYVTGNKGNRSGMSPETDNWPYTREAGPSDNDSVIGPTPQAWRRESPLQATPIPINHRHVDQLEDSILPTVGASRRLDCEGRWVFNRDAVDARVVSEYLNESGQVPSSSSSERDFGGFPVLEPGIPCIDTSGDGVPDEWAKANGLDYTDPSLGRRIDPSGYTHLELYLNGMDKWVRSPASPTGVWVE